MAVYPGGQLQATTTEGLKSQIAELVEAMTDNAQDNANALCYRINSSGMHCECKTGKPRLTYGGAGTKPSNTFDGGVGASGLERDVVSHAEYAYDTSENVWIMIHGIPIETPFTYTVPHYYANVPRFVVTVNGKCGLDWGYVGQVALLSMCGGAWW